LLQKIQKEMIENVEECYEEIKWKENYSDNE
jgi:uncharacterized protein YutD